MVVWFLFAASGLIWLAAIFYIVRGWPKKVEGERSEAKPSEASPPGDPRRGRGSRVEGTKIETKVFPSTFHLPPPTSGEMREIEIPIPEYPSPELEKPEPFDKDAFYRELGRSNVVEFPAEYIDKESVKSVTGEKISMIEFAKWCYRQIGFRCAPSLIPVPDQPGVSRISIFDLAFDHYSRTDEAFINLFGQLKDKFAEDIEAIKNHPDMTPAARKSLVGIYEPLPPLVAWSDKELFLVAVVSAYEDLARNETDFLKEIVIKKKIFKARIFRVTQRQMR